MATKLYRELMVGDQFKFNDQIWIKTNPVKKGCCGSPIIYNAHVFGSQKTNSVFQNDQELEVYKEQEMAKSKKTAVKSPTADLSKTTLIEFRLLDSDDYFMFQGTDTVQRKQSMNSCIDEVGNEIKVPPVTKVNHLYDYLKDIAEEPAPVEADSIPEEPVAEEKVVE